MRLKKSFFSLMAIILALSTCPSAFAEAFTIPAGSTTSCKKTDSPIKDWWPGNGNYSNNAYYAGLDMAALNGQLWILKKYGPSNSLMNITVVDGSTFSKVADADLTGIPTSGNDVLYGNIVQIRRFGDKIIGINCASSYWQNTYFYVWDNATSAPKITKFAVSSWDSSKRVSLGRGLGVYGDMSNGKIYVLSQNKQKVAVFTVSNNTINTDATVITLTNPDTNSSDYAYIEPQSDGSFWVIQQSTYGIHYNADGSQKESFTKDGFPSQYGTGQRHFTFKGRKLAMNFGAASTGATLVSPSLALLDYTSGVGSQTNILKDAVTISDQNQKEALCTACDYEIKTADKHLILYGLDCDGGIIRVEYDEASNLPAVVSNFNATAKWDGATQKVDLTWNAADKATSYRVYDYSDGESSEKKVYEGSDTNCTLDLTIGTGKQHKYRIIGVNSNGTSKNSAYANTYDAGFGNIALTGVIDPSDETATAKLEWNAPTGGTLKNYTIVKSLKKTGNDGTVVNTEEDYTTVPAGTTTYDFANFKSLSSETEGDVTYSIATSLFVRANMEQTITTKDGNINTLKSNTVTPVALSAPYFTSVTTYKGRRTVALSWEVASLTNLDYYELYRDGIKILSAYNSGSYIDADLPDGTYSYTVVAYWTNGTEKSATRSTSVSATIKYSADVATYILDEVYNYPIMTEAEWEAAGKPDDAVVAKGQFANARSAVGAYGAPGDVYRQAQYYGGRWYLQQLTARTETMTDGSKTYIPNNYYQLPSGMTAAQGYAKYRGDWCGGIKSIGADAATIKTIGDNLQSEITTWGLECQFVAVDEEGNKWRRATHSGPFSAYDTGYTGSDNGDGYGATNALFYRPTIFIHGNTGEVKITYNGKSFYELAKDSSYGDKNQYYRTHYISAGGKYSQGTAFLLFSMNRSADVYRVCMNNNNTIKSVDLFTAPISEAVAAGAASSDPTAATENYSFPVAGRNAFIQTVRGIGTWYVDGNTKKYSLMYSNTADITQCGGVTFTFNNEMFILHPSTIRSNNPGYFRIDMAQRKSGETAENVVPSRDNLVPIVANKLDESAQFSAGNSNASWYGTEYDSTDDCMYIYQYVPGVRFAKYRLYIREQYPDVPPTLDITTGYNDDKTDITRFDSKITWQRPGSAHDYGMSENADIVVDHYEVALKDKDGNTLKSWNDVADVKDASHVFTLEYNKTDAGVYNLDSEKYTAEITPIYKRKSGVIIRGASNFAVDDNDYPAAIGEVNAWIYKGTQNGYRVDLDFDRAGAAASTEPVSYFLVEVSTDGGNTFTTLSNFNLLKNGEDYHYYPVTVTNGQISGQYKFGTDYPGDTPSEKGYALREKANYATDHKCVLYYYTNTDPSDYKYRVTAVYAATNRAISKTASNIATNNIGGTSGIDDMSTYKLSAYPIPATTEITVTSPEAIRDIRIFSAAGAEVVRAAGQDAYTQKVDISNLTAGVYMLVVNEQAPIRIVKK